ncbi:MAG: TonB family protein [Terracidiphilus sp.]
MKANFLRRRGAGAVALSVAVHGALLALLLVTAKWVGVRVVEPTGQRRWITSIEIAGAARRAKMMLPERPQAETAPEPPQGKAITEPAPQVLSGNRNGRKDAPMRDTHGRGMAAHGMGNDDEDVMPAFPVFSPRPAVTDRSLLPQTEQKVVVDVKLSADGAVLDETLVRGLGNSLDAKVMEIVKTWKFHPAMIDGKPVASEAECIFPFDRNYPLGPA